MRFVKFIECEIVHDKMCEHSKCYINPKHVVYIEDDEEHEGYSFIGLVNTTTIVKGKAEEVRKKLEGKIWLKTLHLQ